MLRPLILLLMICIIIVLALADDVAGRSERSPKRGGRRNNGNKQKRCKYQKVGWSKCNEEGLMIQNQTLIQRRGQPNNCEPFELKTKPCGRAAKVKQEKCRYERQGSWSTCTDGTKRKVLNLKSGGSTCSPTKEITKNCTSKNRNVREGRDSSGDCKYRPVGRWSGCVDGQKTRTMTLKKGDRDTCEATRTAMKPCEQKKPKVKCKYQKGSLGECNEETGKVMRTDTLVAEQSDASCEATRTMEVDCKNRAEPKCKYGPWSQFEPCHNGVMKKTRTVIAGKDKQKCQRRAVKIKACEDRKPSKK